jgi:asparagine synthase (glutamine-hydrolysing)
VYLTLGFLPGSLTFLKNVRKLEPGSYLVLENGNVSHRRYWELPATPENEMNRDSRAVCDRFGSLLNDSVKLRMRSDVDFGAFLSGGLDSSAIVSVMAGISMRPVQTFTIGFAQADLDERPVAREVARQFGTDHHEDVVEYPDFQVSISRVLDHTDEPFGDSSCLPTDRVAAYATRKVKMALSGDGGDEVLSGYNAYQSERLAGYLRWAPPAALNGISTLVRLAGRTIGGSIEGSASHAAKIIRLSGVPFNSRLLQKAWADVAIVRALLADVDTPQLPVDELLTGLLKRCPWRDPFYQLMYYNVTATLPEDMMTKADRMTMANSLEVRAPFLDYRLMELMAGVHKDVKLPNFTRKAVLRRTAARGLPRCVTKGKKRGFVAPLQSWLAEEKGAALVNHAVRTCPIPLRGDIIAGVLDANRRREKNYGNFLWMVLMLSEWSKRQAL